MGGLAIGRKPGQKVKVFCNDQVLTITAKLRPEGLIQLNFEGPHDFTIYREEVFKRIIAEKIAIADLTREEISNV